MVAAIHCGNMTAGFGALLMSMETGKLIWSVAEHFSPAAVFADMQPMHKRPRRSCAEVSVRHQWE
jgi:hypothetical protein